MLILAKAVSDPDTANSETKFVEEAVHQLLKARRVLKCSYVYGFYLEDTGYKKPIFEFMQVNAALFQTLYPLGANISHFVLKSREFCFCLNWPSGQCWRLRPDWSKISLDYSHPVRGEFHTGTCPSCKQILFSLHTNLQPLLTVTSPGVVAL